MLVRCKEFMWGAYSIHLQQWALIWRQFITTQSELLKTSMTEPESFTLQRFQPIISVYTFKTI